MIFIVSSCILLQKHSEGSFSAHYQSRKKHFRTMQWMMFYSEVLTFFVCFSNSRSTNRLTTFGLNTVGQYQGRRWRLLRMYCCIKSPMAKTILATQRKLQKMPFFSFMVYFYSRSYQIIFAIVNRKIKPNSFVPMFASYIMQLSMTTIKIINRREYTLQHMSEAKRFTKTINLSRNSSIKNVNVHIHT